MTMYRAPRRRRKEGDPAFYTPADHIVHPASYLWGNIKNERRAIEDDTYKNRQNGAYYKPAAPYAARAAVAQKPASPMIAASENNAMVDPIQPTPKHPTPKPEYNDSAPAELTATEQLPTTNGAEPKITNHQDTSSESESLTQYNWVDQFILRLKKHPIESRYAILAHVRHHAGLESSPFENFIIDCIRQVNQSKFCGFYGNWNKIFQSNLRRVLADPALEEMAQKPDFNKQFPQWLCEQFQESAIMTNAPRPTGGKTNDFLLTYNDAENPTLQPDVRNEVQHFAQYCITQFAHHLSPQKNGHDLGPWQQKLAVPKTPLQLG